MKIDRRSRLTNSHNCFPCRLISYLFQKQIMVAIFPRRILISLWKDICSAMGGFHALLYRHRTKKCFERRSWSTALKFVSRRRHARDTKLLQRIRYKKTAMHNYFIQVCLGTVTVDYTQILIKYWILIACKETHYTALNLTIAATHWRYSHKQWRSSVRTLDHCRSW